MRLAACVMEAFAERRRTQRKDRPDCGIGRRVAASANREFAGAA